MAKKIRFPLEMENGVEVRDLEELKDNFSLARVIGYINDGKLVTWLQDRYENELAEEVEKIDVETEGAAKRICELFDVEYDETAKEEIEKAEERKRKLELLKKFPDCMEYAKYIDSVAFDQNDLYDLLDEDVNEIYLCGNKFVIPIAKNNIKYIGILDKVTVVINSKEPVDFNSRGVIFENCVFDEKYAEVLNEKKKDVKTETPEKVKENTDDLEGVDSEEIHDFYVDLLEIIIDFLDKEFENENDELYEYDDSISSDNAVCNGEWFATKTKAKAACKEMLMDAVSTDKELYEDAKNDLINATESYYADMEVMLIDFLDTDFFDEYKTLMDVYCSGKTREYLENKMKYLKDKVDEWRSDIHIEYEIALNQIIKEHFEKAEKSIISVKELFDMCEYDKDDYDGTYSVCMDDACRCLDNAYEDIIEDEVTRLPEGLYYAYKGVNIKYIKLLRENVFDDRYGEEVDEQQKNIEEARKKLVENIRNAFSRNRKK